MKQFKVANPKLQKLLDGINGWKEVPLCVILWAIAIAGVIWIIHTHK